MRVGLFGGSFDPPHLGHIMVAAYALSVGQFDEVWVLPCWHHAFGKEMEAFGHRVEMAQLAFGIFGGRVRVCEYERDFKTRHTVDLVQRLRETMPAPEYTLILGSDNQQETQRWHRWEELSRMLPILWVPRGSEADPSFFIAGVSSTQVRQAFRDGKPEVAQSLLPPAVFKHIQDNTLYQD